MYHSSISHKIDQEFQRIFSIQPNDLGHKHLTSLYKFFTGPLKNLPFIYLIPLSVLFSVMVYIVLGNLVVKVVNILQYGF